MLDAIDIVKGSFAVNGQFQVVIGQGTVNKVYAELVKETGMGEASKDDVKKAAAQNESFTACCENACGHLYSDLAGDRHGLLMGLNNILTAEGIFYSAKSIVQVYPQWADLANMINLIAGTAFAFLPALIGWSAVKRFGGSPLLGIVLGLMLVHPDLLNAWGYGAAEQSGDIPVWNLFYLRCRKSGIKVRCFRFCWRLIYLPGLSSFDETDAGGHSAVSRRAGDAFGHRFSILCYHRSDYLCDR